MTADERLDHYCSIMRAIMSERAVPEAIVLYWCVGMKSIFDIDEQVALVGMDAYFSLV